MSSNLVYKPSNVAIEAEEFVIGSALVDGRVVFDLNLLPEHFFSKKHQDIWEAILEIVKAGTEPDILSVLDVLERKDKLEAGTEAYLMQLVASVPNASNASYYASIVKREYKRREFIFATQRAMQTALTGDVDGAFTQLAEIEKLRFDVGDVPFSEIFTEEDFKRIASYKRWSFDSLPRLSKYVPFVIGESIYIAGQTSQGKTQLALHLAFDLVKQGAVVGYYSTEIDRWSVLGRLINYEANTKGQISLHDIDLRNPHWQAIGQAILQQPEYKRFHFFREFYRMEELTASIEAHTFDVVFIDYIQNLTFSSSNPKNRVEELGNIAREIRRLSQRRCMITLSQFNRVRKEEENEIDLGRIRDSGEIEQTATTVILIRRDRDDKQLFYYAVAKNQTYGMTTGDWKRMILLPNGIFKEE